MSTMLQFILFWYWVLISHSHEEESVVEKFVPTSEWAEIKEGQSIRKGLHVRMNLERGLKEAKLLSEDDENVQGENRLTIKDDNIVDVGVVDGDKIDVAELEEGLKRLANSGESSETVSGKFRTIEELKELMPHHELKTEGEVMKHKMLTLNSTSKADVPSLIIVLEELEDLAHKYDNGQLLVTQGWMEQIGQLFHHDNENVYKSALRVMSSAAQSNPTVQVHCIQMGYLSTLVSQLLSQPERLAKSTVFTISALIRNIPAARETFQKIHGYNTLSTKFALSSLPPLQRAILTLYNDLLDSDIQEGSNVVLKNLKIGDKLLCKKMSDILTDSSSSTDVIREAVLFYKRINQWCSQDINTIVTVRLKELQILFESNNDEEVVTLLKTVLS